MPATASLKARRPTSGAVAGGGEGGDVPLHSSASSSNDEAGSEPAESEDDSGGNGSEPDFLDDTVSRKRRRISLSPDSDGGRPDGDGPAPATAPVFSAPSRIRRRPAERAPSVLPEVPEPPLEPAKKILAPTDPDTTFDSLGVSPWLVQSLSNMAIKRPTAIQKLCIPEILKGGRDCIGGSRTGSGKTCAFATPIIQKWAEDPSAIFALVLTPTRELALQIVEQFKSISSPHILKTALITGGAEIRAQAIALADRPHVVVATPGRLADHIRTSGEDTICGLRRVRYVVLDEADRLLAGGHGSMLPAVEECLGVLPPPLERQTLLFTATMTPEVRALKDMPRKPGKEPVFVCEVNTDNMAIPASLHQAYVQVPVVYREHYLHVFLETEGNKDRSTIVFCNRTATVNYLHHLLSLLGHTVTSLHSKLPQRDRIDNLGRFRAQAARILVATDIAARGLDIAEVALVVNFDVPRDPDDYIHRVGRTARAGRKGEAVTLVGQRDVSLVLAIEERVGRPLEAWSEEGVNLETRVLRDALKMVGEKKREALLNIEENREVGGKRKRGKEKLRA